MNNMTRQDQNSVVAVYSQHSAAEDAIKQLKGGGFDIKKLAVVGRTIRRKRMSSVSITQATG